MSLPLKVALAGCGFLVLAFAAWLAYIAFEMVYYGGQLGPGLAKDLGFSHGSPYVRCGSSYCEVFTIESVTSGGEFDRAGFRAGDIVCDLSITQFYMLLHQRRGQEITIRVVEGGDGPPLDQRTVRNITFTVPAAK